MQSRRLRSLFVPLLPLSPLALLVALGIAACSDSKSPSADPGPLPSAFGGSGGAVTAQPAGGGGALATAGASGQTTTLPSACQNVPKGKVALLDDFEDGDSAAFSEPGREGFWVMLHDETAGMVDPSGVLVPEKGGAGGTKLAAHVKAAGYSGWGASFATTLSYLSDGVRCPYNASGFAGLRFYMRGSGRTRITLATLATQDKEYGGACDPDKGMICYDGHGTYAGLTPEWTLYELPWSIFQQSGWGTPAELRADQILVVQFTFDSGDLPVDLWLDEVSFWDGKPTPTPSGEAGAGGEGGTSAGGAGGEGGA